MTAIYTTAHISVVETEPRYHCASPLGGGRFTVRLVNPTPSDVYLGGTRDELLAFAAALTHLAATAVVESSDRDETS